MDKMVRQFVGGIDNANDSPSAALTKFVSKSLFYLQHILETLLGFNFSCRSND